MDNRNKDKEVDESILDETPPNINEPQNEEDKPENQDPNPDPAKEEGEEDVAPTIKEEEVVDDSKGKVEDKPEKIEESPTETQEEKDQRYKSQQTEAQIQAARTRAITQKVDEAANLPEPTEQELRDYVATKGGDWDLLSPFEQSLAKDTLINTKKFNLVNESVQTVKKIDEWAAKVDEFIDSTDAKPEFVKLSGHEAEFRRFAMKESHRGAPIDSLLLPAFLNQLPAPVKKRNALFETGGGGEKAENPTVITDADTAATLRQTNPREYKRQLKAGKIKVEV